MGSVMIVFDEKSLVLSKNDYTSLSQYFKTNGEWTYCFFEEELCFVAIKKEEPMFTVFFTQIELEGTECYEISEIRHILDKVPNLPDQLEDFNQATEELIRHVFNLLNEAIISNEMKQVDWFYKYYIKDLKTDSYDIRLLQERVNLADFVGDLSYVFGIDD